MSENLAEQGKRLKEVRVALKKTQEELAVTLLGNTNKATISAYEKGRMPIAEKAKVKLFLTLGVNESWFYDGVGDMFAGNKSVTNTAKRVTKSIGDFVRDAFKITSKIPKDTPPEDREVIEDTLSEIIEELVKSNKEKEELLALLKKANEES